MKPRLLAVLTAILIAVSSCSYYAPYDSYYYMPYGDYHESYPYSTFYLTMTNFPDTFYYPYIYYPPYSYSFLPEPSPQLEEQAK